MATTSDWIWPTLGKARVFQRVVVQEHGGHRLDHLVDPVAAVVDHAERAPSCQRTSFVRLGGEGVDDLVVGQS